MWQHDEYEVISQKPTIPPHLTPRLPRSHSKHIILSSESHFKQLLVSKANSPQDIGTNDRASVTLDSVSVSFSSCQGGRGWRSCWCRLDGDNRSKQTAAMTSTQPLRGTFLRWGLWSHPQWMFCSIKNYKYNVASFILWSSATWCHCDVFSRPCQPLISIAFGFL